MKIDKIQINDYQNIVNLNKKNNLESLDKADWENIWFNNPYIKKNEKKNWILGWKLIDENKNIFGVILNIPFVFKLKDKEYLAAVCSNYVIDKNFRSFSLKLRHFFLSQNGVDLYITNTANMKSEKIMEAFKARKINQYDYQERLIYILKIRNFNFSFLKNLNTTFLLNFLKKIFSKHKKTKLDDISFKIEKNFDILKNIESDFDLNKDFHSSKKIDWLEWKYDIYLKKEKILVINVYRKKKLIGSLVLLENIFLKNNLKKISIVEILGFNNNLEYLSESLEYCIDICKKDQFDIIDVVGFKKDKRLIIEKVGFFKRKSKNFNFLIKNDNVNLENILFHDFSNLDLSVRDGDGIFYI